MCGIIGIVSQQAVAQVIYDGLLVLQHRGQDSAGIVVSDGDKLKLRKGNGQVSDVFHTRHMLDLVGNMGIGHVRYPTAGSSGPALAQHSGAAVCRPEANCIVANTPAQTHSDDEAKGGRQQIHRIRYHRW